MKDEEDGFSKFRRIELMFMGCDGGWRYDLVSWRRIPRGAALGPVSRWMD